MPARSGLVALIGLGLLGLAACGPIDHGNDRDASGDAGQTSLTGADAAALADASTGDAEGPAPAADAAASDAGVVDAGDPTQGDASVGDAGSPSDAAVSDAAPGDTGVRDGGAPADAGSSTADAAAGDAALPGDGGGAVDAGGGDAGQPAALLSIAGGATHDFGVLGIGSSGDQLFTIINNGPVAATAISPNALPPPFSFHGGVFPGTDGSCGPTLAPGERCTILLTFTPDSTAPADGSMTLNYFDGAVMRSLVCVLHGTGTNLAALRVTDWPLQYYSTFGLPADGPQYDFGTWGLGASFTHVFYVSNMGGALASGINATPLLASFTFPGGAFPGAGGDCGNTLEVGSSCAVVVTFSPMQLGSISQPVVVSYFDGAVMQSIARTVTGGGTNLALLVIDDFDNVSFGASYDYGITGVGVSASHTFNVTNQGAVAATEMNGVPGAAEFPFRGGTYPGIGGDCGATLAAGASCTITVSFAPTATGPATGAAQIGYVNGAAPVSVARSLAGEGTSSAFLVLRDDHGQQVHNFGVHGLGISTDATFHLVNVGAVAASGLTTDFLVPPYTYKDGSYPGTGGTCGWALDAGASCTVVVTFTPFMAGSSLADLSIRYDDGGVVRHASRSMSGEGTSFASLRIADGEGDNASSSLDIPFDYGVTGVPVDHTFYVINDGAQTAQGLIATGLNPPFAYKGGMYPGTGGTCGSSLSAADWCSVVVTLSPIVPGVAGGEIRIDYSGGATRTVLLGLTGVATDHALLSIRDSGLGGGGGGGGSDPFDFGTSGIPLSHVFTVMNIGAQTATGIADQGGLAPGFGYAGGSYPGTGGTCGTSLASGASCTIDVRFTPFGSGVQSGRIALGYSDGFGIVAATRAVQGTATQGAYLVLSDWPGSGAGGPEPFDFGTYGISVDHTFTLLNLGAVTATGINDAGTLGPFFSYESGAYPGAGGDCGFMLAPGASCTIVVRFTPAGVGLRSGRLTLKYSGGSVTRDVTGTATDSALLKIADGPWGGGSSAFDYGVSGNPVDHTFTISNVGAQAAGGLFDASTLGPGFVMKGGSYPGTGGTCGFMLASGSSCTVVVTFVPVGNGSFAGTILIEYAGGAGLQATARAVTGTATSFALLEITDCDQCSSSPQGAFDYGTAGIPVDHTFTVRNVGGQPASGIFDGSGSGPASTFSFAGGAYPGTGGTCGSNLDRAASCTIVVRFTPMGSGTISGKVAVQYGSGSGNAFAVRQLQGTATRSAYLVLSDWMGSWPAGPPFDYGSSGIPVDHTFTISNLGAQAATGLFDASRLAPAFAMKGGSYPGTGGTCGAMLAQGASCTIVVTFAPAGSGPFSGTIEIDYSDGTGLQSVRRAVTGTATNLALLEISDCDQCGTSAQGAFDYGIWGVPVDHTFTVRNTGAQLAAGIGNSGGPAAAFSFTGGAYPGTGGTCGGSLAAAATCTIVVRFTPSGDGPASGAIVLSYGGGAGPATATRKLAGTATTHAYLTVLEAGGGCGDACGPYSYGTVAVGTPSDRSFRVFNSGGAAVQHMNDAGLLTSPFAYRGGTFPGTAGTCASTLAAGASCTVVVTFSPTSVVTSRGTLALDYTGGTQPTTRASRSLIGTGR